MESQILKNDRDDLKLDLYVSKTDNNVVSPDTDVTKNLWDPYKTSSDQMTPGRTEMLRCWNCNRTGHTKKQCRRKAPIYMVTCRNCKKPGHMAWHCKLPSKYCLLCGEKHHGKCNAMTKTIAEAVTYGIDQSNKKLKRLIQITNNLEKEIDRLFEFKTWATEEIIFMKSANHDQQTPGPYRRY